MPLSDDQIKERLGKALKRERNRQKKSQEWLALEAEIDRSYMSGLERGKENISIIKIYRICHVLKVNPSDLLKDAGL